jgi:hypothetical protein
MHTLTKTQSKILGMLIGCLSAVSEANRGKHRNDRRDHSFMKPMSKSPYNANKVRRGRRPAGVEFHGPDGTLFWHRRALIKAAGRRPAVIERLVAESLADDDPTYRMSGHAEFGWLCENYTSPGCHEFFARGQRAGRFTIHPLIDGEMMGRA